MTIKIEQAEGRVPQEELEFFLKGTLGLDHSRMRTQTVRPHSRPPGRPGAASGRACWDCFGSMLTFPASEMLLV